MAKLELISLSFSIGYNMTRYPVHFPFRQHVDSSFVMEEDKQSFRGQNWLTGEAVDYSLRKLLYTADGEKKYKFELMLSSMWPLLEFSFEDVLNQWKTSRVLTDTTIVIPIFCANHWFLGIIDINNKSNPTVGIYDSKHQDRPAEGLLLGRIASFLTSRPSTFIKLAGP